MKFFSQLVFARNEAISSHFRHCHQQIATLHCVTLAMTNKKMNNPSAPIKAVSSQRSEEIEPKAGIAIPNTRGQFAPNEKNFLFIYLPILVSTLNTLLLQDNNKQRY